MSEKDLKKLIRETLSSMIFEFSDSYLFIFSMDGTELLNPGLPKMEHKIS